MIRKSLAVGLALVALVGSGFAKAAEGTPPLKSIEAIAFGPAGLLLIGDGKGGQVVAIETGDTTPQDWTAKSLADVKGAVAGRLGTDAQGIDIRKIAVNPASRKAYLAVRRMSGKNDLIVTIDGAGKVSEFPLDNVKYTVYSLAAEGDKQGISTISDLAWSNDRILVAGLADQFGSHIYTVGVKSGPASFSTETFHVAHNKWETKAPIRTVIPYQQDGKQYLVGAFTCTPIVKYSIDDIKAGTKVVGTSVVELGNGNTPQDMFTYEKGGKRFILMNVVRNAKFHQSNPVGPSPYWTARIDQDLLQEATNINEKALRRVGNKANESKTERAIVVPEFHGVMQMDQLDANRALVIRTDAKGSTELAILDLP